MKRNQKRSILVVFFCSLFHLSLSAISVPAEVEQVHKVGIQANYSKLPVYFICNSGQFDPKVKFYVKKPSQTLYFTEEGIIFDFLRWKMQKLKDGASLKRFDQNTGRKAERLVFELKFQNPLNQVAIEGIERQDSKINYLIGNDISKWKTGVPTYKGIVYKGIYKNIDLRVFGNNKDIEYEFIVNPGGNPNDILLTYEGIESLTRNKEGELLIKTIFGEFKETRPYIYQEKNEKRVVEGDFEIRISPNQTQTQEFSYGFQITSYDPSYPLIIDPTLLYSTYLGGSAQDTGQGIAVDALGNAYVTGYTYSNNFPTKNSYQENFAGGSRDAFITKLSASGSSLEYSTYLGGRYDDTAYAVAVDGSGNAYITGYTESDNFPTKNAYQGTRNYQSYDAFVTKLSASGSSLEYSTYLGGGYGEMGYGIAVDSSGNAYVTGHTGSSNFPTKNAYQEKTGDGPSDVDVFITKFSTSGSTLEYSTYLGGSSSEYGQGIAVNDTGNTYITGRTGSSNFPTKNAYQGSHNVAFDAFITKLSASGSSLEYSTYLGGEWQDEANAIAVDGSGNAYITGVTQSIHFPTKNAFQQSCTCGSPTYLYDIFITKLSASGSSLEYSTYLGGDYSENVYGIAVDSSGNAYVTGETWSSNFPTKNAYQENLSGVTDAFITKLSASGSSLEYSTYLGGGSYDGCFGIAVDSRGNAYVGGNTNSINFPTEGPYQGAFAGVSDVVVVKLGIAPPTVTTTAVSDITATTATSGGNITSDGGAEITARGVCWSTSANPTTANSKTTEDTGTGSFTSSITGLTLNTKYYVKAYAMNSVGTSYGDEVTFTTLNVGSLTITLYPQGALEAGGKWNVDGGDWQDSGAAVSGLDYGEHTLRFKDIDGWIPPTMRTVTMFTDQTTSSAVYPQETGRIPDTGQVQCYNNTEGIDCPQPGEDFYGQDGNYLINPPSYAKLDADENDLPDSATSWVMVRDNVTGLIWEVKTDDGSIHDKDNLYTWYDSNPATNGGNAGTPGDGTDTEDFINTLNAERFGGHDDWRLPAIKELSPVVNSGVWNPATGTEYFPNTASSNYWSSSTAASNIDNAWNTNFNNGGYGFNPKYGGGFCVRAVRGIQAVLSDHLVNNGDGTITDLSTGLMWQKIGSESGMTWESAMTHCNGLTLASYSDWRLPIREELHSIVDHNVWEPAINTNYFPDTASLNYWSSSTLAQNTDLAWRVRFHYGTGFYDLKSDSDYVRAVRGGQNQISGHLLISIPNQGSTWNLGDEMNISWDTQSISGNVKISISRQGGKTDTFETIVESTENDGSYNWTVTGQISTNCALKIEPLSDPSKGTMQSLFSIASATAPSATISGAPVGYTNQANADITIAGQSIISYKYKLDDGAYGDETLVTNQILLTNLTDGAHTIYVLGRDAAGAWQTAPTTATWTVDTVAPTITGLTDDATPTQSKTWAWDANETATFRYNIDQNQTWTPSGDFNTTKTATKSGVSGTWYIHVQAKDTAGNESAVTTASTVLNDNSSTLYISVNGGCGDKAPCYKSIQAAINDAATGSVILVKKGTYEESLSVGSAKSIFIKGGYDSTDYDQQTANTTFVNAPGATTIKPSSGSLKFQMINVK